MAIVQASKAAGTLKIEAASPGLEPVTARVTAGPDVAFTGANVGERDAGWPGVTGLWRPAEMAGTAPRMTRYWRPSWGSFPTWS